MVLSETVKMMTATGSYQLISNLPARKFGPWTFRGVDMESTAFGAALKHRTYVGMLGEYALMITITVQKDSNPSMFDPVLNGIGSITK